MVETSGEWREERFYVLRTLDRLEGELKEKTKEIAKQEDRDEKRRLDMNEAHARIRGLQSAAKTARLKSWAATGAASFLGVVVIELMRFILK
jgi:VIT1/CCC1 family predicted Fe2+/Mn2+ transporter